MDEDACRYMQQFHRATNPTFACTDMKKEDVHVTFVCNPGSAYQNAYESLPIEVHQCIARGERGLAIFPLKGIASRIDSCIDLDKKILTDELRNRVSGLIALVGGSVSRRS